MRGDLQEGYFALPDANFLSSWCQFPFSRAQNRGFCALLAFETLIFGLYEHKIEVFVLFWPSGPLFSSILSTKSRFLCFFTLRNPHFRAFRAQNRNFCELLSSEPPVFWHFEHKIDIFVLGQTGQLLRSAAWWRCCGALPGGDAAKRRLVEMLRSAA